MNRSEKREAAMFCVYQKLVLDRDSSELISDNFKDEPEDEYFSELVRTACREKDRYASYADQVLENWHFDRLGLIEQALILCGCAEFDLKEVEASVIIDEYIELAKKNCDEDSYKLINGVLDRI